MKPGLSLAPRRRFVLSSVPSDAHMWNLVVLQLFIEEMGHEVVNLGVCVPVDVLVARCRAEQPDCVVISTVNGHGYIDGVSVIDALRADPECADLLVVIGGTLGVVGDRNTDLAGDLLDHGYDAVFPVAAGETDEAMGRFREFVAERMRLPA